MPSTRPGTLIGSSAWKRMIGFTRPPPRVFSIQYAPANVIAAPSTAHQHAMTRLLGYARSRPASAKPYV